MDLLIVNRGGYQNGFELSKDCLILGMKILLIKLNQNQVTILMSLFNQKLDFLQVFNFLSVAT